jgi:hypothetical protein
MAGRIVERSSADRIMVGMWSGRTIVALATLLGACAPLPTQQQTLERRVAEVL